MTNQAMREPTFLILTALAGGAQHGYGICEDRHYSTAEAAHSRGASRRRRAGWRIGMTGAGALERRYSLALLLGTA